MCLSMILTLYDIMRIGLQRPQMDYITVENCTQPSLAAAEIVSSTQFSTHNQSAS